MICGLGDAVAAAIKSLAVASRYRRVGSNWLGGIERRTRLRLVRETSGA